MPECRGYRDGGVLIDCKYSGGPIGPVMGREIGMGESPNLCRRCADRRRALGNQVRATEPPEEPKRFDESNGYMETDYGTVYPWP